MSGFDKNYILDKLSQIEDGETTFSQLIVKGEYDEEIPEEIRNLADETGAIVVYNYTEIGMNGYEAMGICNFIPIDAEEVSEVLTVNIVVSDEIDEIGIYDMYKLINMVNNRIVTGRFILSDDEKILGYRTNIALSKQLDNDAALVFALDQVLGAVGEVSLWVDILMGYNDGDMDIDACIEAVNENSVLE